MREFFQAAAVCLIFAAVIVSVVAGVVSLHRDDASHRKEKLRLNLVHRGIELSDEDLAAVREYRVIVERKQPDGKIVVLVPVP